MGLKVIGAGFGRTGTDSMREALTILGFGPCLHMFEIIGNESLKQAWRARARDENISWDELCKGYNSALDWPAAYYWRELMEAYPQAKVILTYRSAESWHASFEKTILPHISAASDPETLGVRIMRNKVFGGNPDDKAHAIAVYDANVREVKATVSKDRLLIHELGDGWESLCAFLGVPVPQQDYPNRNAADGFQDRAQAVAAAAKP